MAGGKKAPRLEPSCSHYVHIDERSNGTIRLTFLVTKVSLDGCLSDELAYYLRLSKSSLAFPFLSFSNVPPVVLGFMVGVVILIHLFYVHLFNVRTQGYLFQVPLSSPCL